jgi:hypothetical protein
MRKNMKSNREVEARQNLQGYVIIGVCLLLLGGGGVAVALNRPSPRDVVTGCEAGNLALHETVIGDRSDPWGASDRAILRSAIAKLGENFPTGGRLTLIAFDGGADMVPEPLFDKCRPLQGRDVNAIFTTPDKVEKVFAVSFAVPLAKTVDELTRLSNASGAPNTNLVQFIATTAALSSRWPAERRRIRIFSDMAEHTPLGSLIGKKAFDPASFTAYFKERMGDRLKGFDLEIVVTPSASTPPAVARRIKAAWAAALSASGVTYSWGNL